MLYNWQKWRMASLSAPTARSGRACSRSLPRLHPLRGTMWKLRKVLYSLIWLDPAPLYHKNLGIAIKGRGENPLHPFAHAAACPPWAGATGPPPNGGSRRATAHLRPLTNPRECLSPSLDRKLSPNANQREVAEEERYPSPPDLMPKARARSQGGSLTGKTYLKEYPFPYPPPPLPLPWMQAWRVGADTADSRSRPQHLTVASGRCQNADSTSICWSSGPFT